MSNAISEKIIFCVFVSFFVFCFMQCKGGTYVLAFSTAFCGKGVQFIISDKFVIIFSSNQKLFHIFDGRIKRAYQKASIWSRAQLLPTLHQKLKIKGARQMNMCDAVPKGAGVQRVRNRNPLSNLFFLFSFFNFFSFLHIGILCCESLSH